MKVVSLSGEAVKMWSLLEVVFCIFVLPARGSLHKWDSNHFFMGCPTWIGLVQFTHSIPNLCSIPDKFCAIAGCIFYKVCSHLTVSRVCNNVCHTKSPRLHEVLWCEIPDDVDNTTIVTDRGTCACTYCLPARKMPLSWSIGLTYQHSC